MFPIESIHGFGTATALTITIGTSTEERRQAEKEKEKEGKEVVKAIGVGSREIEVHLASDMVADGEGRESELPSVPVTNSTPVDSCVTPTAPADSKSRTDCVDSITAEEGKSDCGRVGNMMQTSVLVAVPLFAPIGTRHSLSSASDTSSSVTPIARCSSADGVDGDIKGAVSGGEGQGQGEKEKEEHSESERQGKSKSGHTREIPSLIPPVALVTPGLSISPLLLDPDSNLSAVGRTGWCVAAV